MTRAVPNRAANWWASPSPSGRRWPEGPDEGPFSPSPAASRHPLPRERALSQTGFYIDMKAETRIQLWFPSIYRNVIRRVWSMTPTISRFQIVGGHRPPLQLADEV